MHSRGLSSLQTSTCRRRTSANRHHRAPAKSPQHALMDDRHRVTAPPRTVVTAFLRTIFATPPRTVVATPRVPSLLRACTYRRRAPANHFCPVTVDHRCSEPADIVTAPSRIIFAGPSLLRACTYRRCAPASRIRRAPVSRLSRAPVGGRRPATRTVFAGPSLLRACTYCCSAPVSHLSRALVDNRCPAPANCLHLESPQMLNNSNTAKEYN